MIPALPIRTRLVSGECLNSYARRHAIRNRSTVQAIELGLQQDRMMLRTLSWSSPERKRVWRALGELSPSAFSSPTHQEGSPLHTRRLCSRCAFGEAVAGVRLDAGYVCLKHRYWTHEIAQDLASFPEWLKAERKFRRKLVARGLHANHGLFRIAQDCAVVSLPPETIAERERLIGQRSTAILTYPETIAVLDIISRPSVRHGLEGDLRTDNKTRLHLRKELSEVFSTNDPSENARGVHLLMASNSSAKARRAHFEELAVSTT